MRTVLVVTAFALLGVMAIAAAQQPAAAPPKPMFGCKTAEARQFDFWIGEWNVTDPTGKPAGHSRIESILDGCAIAEHWEGKGGSNGKSYNLYDVGAKNWQQFWVDNQGTSLHLVGQFSDGHMQLSGAPRKDGDKISVERITWTPNADGSVRQHWEHSDDGGKGWTTSFDGIYRKVK